jgi:hypothetical protein
MFKTLERFFGRDDISFTFVSDEFNGVTRDDDGSIRPLIPRTFDSFSEASEENGQSRIYLGIHWSFDKTEGIRSGNQVANFIFNNFLRSYGGRPSSIAGSDLELPANTGTTPTVFLVPSESNEIPPASTPVQSKFSPTPGLPAPDQMTPAPETSADVEVVTAVTAPDMAEDSGALDPLFGLDEPVF